jgi:phosphohistidine phosphatase SixA
VAELVFTFPLSAQQAVFVVRHAERLDRSEDSPLTEDGKKRALALFNTLKAVGIGAIYTSDKQRTIKTAEPLSQSLNIKPIEVPRGPNNFDNKAGINFMISQIRNRNQSDSVLIVYHHTELPEIIEIFGCRKDIKISEDEYDNLFILIVKPDACLMTLNLKY